MTITPTPLSTTYAPEHFLDIPEPYIFSKVQKILMESQNFAKIIMCALFPELYTEEKRRQVYSYYGGGRLNKIELCPVKKGYLERYVLFFHPELRNKGDWSKLVVDRINVSLRAKH
jgi:hypothetical protein